MYLIEVKQVESGQLRAVFRPKLLILQGKLRFASANVRLLPGVFGGVRGIRTLDAALHRILP